jgi:DNA-binding CsgD family transcriptional regulator
MASQNENGVFGEILERLYRAATGEARWECVFAAISESTSSNHAFYQEQDYPTGNTTRLLHDAVPLEAFEAYLAEWVNVDPRLDFALRNPTEPLYNDYLLTDGDKHIYNTPFYKDFLARYELQYWAASSVTPPISSDGKNRVAYLGINRRESAGHVSQKDCELLIGLRPHFERALSIEGKLGATGSRMDMLGDTLNALAYGIVIVDGSATIKWANEKAKRILGSRDGIASEKGILAATTAIARKQLRNIIADACRTWQDPRLKPGGAILIPREFGASIEALIAPLPSNSPPIADLVNDLRNCAVCFLSERDQMEFNAEQALMALYGLTRSEANLAIELSNGATLREAADVRGVTYETARTQIKNIYSKTDTHTQAQLVGVVLRSPTAFLKG